MEKQTIIVASANKGKLKEIADMLPSFNVKGYIDCGLNFDIEETGNTFYENSLIKAKAVSKVLNLPVLADDSGLCVEALNGEPGIYSARYSGMGDNGNIDLLLENLKDKENRKAKFVCCMVYYMPNGKILTAVGETFGEILLERDGENGFGYDPIFYSFDLKKSLGVASEEEKNKISHRARALAKIKELIENEK